MTKILVAVINARPPERKIVAKMPGINSTVSASTTG